MPCEPGYEYIYRKMTGDVPPLISKRFLSFEQFLQFVASENDLSSCNPHWRRQVDLLFYSILPYTHIGQIEELDKTADLLQNHLRFPERLRLTSSNSSGKTDMALSEDLAERIYQLYVSDFIAFGYDKESWRTRHAEATTESGNPDARMMDEIVERNLVISHLYKEYAEIEWRYRAAYRFSLARLRDSLRRILGRTSDSKRTP